MADAPWTARDLALHFEEAVRTLRKLPPVQVTGYFNAWPEVQRSKREIAAMEVQPLRLRASPEAIARLDQTFDWVRWLDANEGRLVWLRAAKVPWKRITWELGCDRTTAWRRWTLALTKIAARLNGAPSSSSF